MGDFWGFDPWNSFYIMCYVDLILCVILACDRVLVRLTQGLCTVRVLVIWEGGFSLCKSCFDLCIMNDRNPVYTMLEGFHVSCFISVKSVRLHVLYVGIMWGGFLSIQHAGLSCGFGSQNHVGIVRFTALY